MISLLTFAPALAALFMLALPRDKGGLMRVLALLATLFSLGLTLTLLAGFDPDAGLQFEERYAWLPSLGVEYRLGLDGSNALILLLAALMGPIAVVASWDSPRPKLWFSLLCLQFTGLFGAFTALNFFHWFVFWEVCLVPAFFLIKLFGGPRRDNAALGFFLFTVVGSVPLLLGFQLLFAATGTFDLLELSLLAQQDVLLAVLGPLYTVAFLLVLVGLWVKMPLIPLHLWQPAAYTEAPPVVSMLLSALLSKMGVYGFIRVVMPIFPDALTAWAPALLAVSVGTALLGAFLALRQKDLKTLLAYSSLNHVAYCALGLSAVANGSIAVMQGQGLAFQGAILQMFAHGLSVAGLFYVAGLLESRRGSRGLDDFGGVGTEAPRLTFAFGVFAFASLGLPFLAGFAAEFPLFMGVFTVDPLWALAAIPALLATAIFLLSAIQRIFTGQRPPSVAGWQDLTLREALVVVPLAVLVVLVGVVPSAFLNLSEPAVRSLLTLYR